jgi:hypothetical protein
VPEQFSVDAASALTVNSGYEPQFDLAADPETIKFLAFRKDLDPRR